MDEKTIKALELAHIQYKEKCVTEVEIKNMHVNANKKAIAGVSNPWDCLTKPLLNEFNDLVRQEIIAEHHSEGLIKSDREVKQEIWVGFKSTRGLK